MTTAILLQQILHVFKECQVPSLVGGDGNPLHIFLDGAFHYLRHRPVMPEMDDFSPLGLQQTTHDIDSGVMTIEKRSGRNEPYFMYRSITHSGNVWKTKAKLSLKN